MLIQQKVNIDMTDTHWLSEWFWYIINSKIGLKYHHTCLGLKGWLPLLHVSSLLLKEQGAAGSRPWYGIKQQRKWVWGDVRWRNQNQNPIEISTSRSKETIQRAEWEVSDNRKGLEFRQDWSFELNAPLSVKLPGNERKGKHSGRVAWISQTELWAHFALCWTREKQKRSKLQTREALV